MTNQSNPVDLRDDDLDAVQGGRIGHKPDLEIRDTRPREGLVSLEDLEDI
ncbi:MAG: hypothetical protein AAGD13_16300 [Pseudomonadota bacterium]